MALIKTKKVQLLTLKENESKVLEYLQNAESFSSQNFENKKKDDGVVDLRFKDVEKNKSDIAFAISYLSKFNETKKEFKYSLMGGREISSINEVEKTVKNFDFTSVVEKCKELESKVILLKNRKSEIKKEIELISRFKNIDCDTSLSSELKSHNIFIGEAKQIDYSLIKDEIQKQHTLVDFLEISSNKNNVSFLIIYAKSISESIKTELSKFSVLEFKDFKKYKNIGNTFTELNSEIIQIDSEIASNEEISKDFSINLKDLKLCHDYFLWLNNQKEASDNSHFTEKTISIYGWAREDKIKNIKEDLEQITKGAVEIIRLEAKEGEVAPVEIENKGIFKPFENVTKLYGLPKEIEIDPTTLLAPFFFVFFAFCLTDAVYGLILLVSSLLVLKFMYVPRETKSFFKLIAFLGLSTFLAGILFGGYAGLQEYGIIPDSLMALQVFDMTKGMELVMGLAFGLGFLHILFGTITKGVMSWKKGNKASAFFMNFSWPIFFTAIGAEIYLQSPSSILWITIGLMAFSITYDAKGLMKIVALPFNIINEAIAWGSNVLSYARLFALGISTGIIAIVFNQIAMTLGGMMPPVINIIVIVFIILLGHTLNIAMNGLGAFIHSARLQFVEFFGKFLEGGGKAFKPMKKESVHVYLEDK